MPTLAHLSFFLPPAQLDDFASLYDRILSPLLQPHGLDSGFSDDRPSVAGVFSRLFAVDSPTALIRTTQALRLDSTWQSALKALESRLGASFRYHLGIYSTPAGEGTVTEVGHGQRQGPWQVLSVADGLGSPLIGALLWDRQGRLWIGTWDGLSCFDGAQFTNYTQADGLAWPRVRSLLQDRQGRLWVGTYAEVCYDDGKEYTSLVLDTDTDQWRNLALAIHEDRQGQMWFVCFRGDIRRYDGQEVVTVHRSEGRWGHIHTSRAIVEDGQGRLWFASGDPGLRCWDQGELRTYTQADGLQEDDVRTVGVDRQGRLWVVFGTGGVSYWDGQAFHTVTPGEGLGFAPGRVVKEDRQGRIWFATDGGGVSCWDGERFTRYTMAEGLVYDRVFAILEDAQGRMWFGTQGGGVSIYDDQVFQTPSTQDGLVNDVVQEILCTRQGHIWIATEGGITRYTPSTQAPGVRLKQIAADRTYTPEEPISVSSGQTRVSFTFQGSNFTSRPDRLVYRYMLEGHDSAWRTTRERRAEYLYLPLGEYTFQVQAVDADLNYSEPATVALEITPDPQAQMLREMMERSELGGEFIGESIALRQVKTYLAQVAPTDLTVLILGETGTGKGVAAHLLHDLSPRKDGTLVVVTCGAIPKGLEESSLFGHEKGAFTSAVERKRGWVELAKGGTLFLDEIGDLPLEAQAKLLRLLEERTFERVGGTQTLRSEARVIAATNRDLERMVREGTFRQDLFYRLQVGLVRLPPLRERRDDILALARHFIAKAAASVGKNSPGLTLEVEALLLAYSWPGNVRQLKHLLELAVVVCREPYLWKQDLPINLESQPGQEEWVSLDENERRYIVQVLDQTQGIIKGPNGAAAILDKHEATLRNRMRKLGIQRRAG